MSSKRKYDNINFPQSFPRIYFQNQFPPAFKYYLSSKQIVLTMDEFMKNTHYVNTERGIYDFQHELGSGSFGCVVLASDRGNNKLYAIKVIKQGTKKLFHKNKWSVNEHIQVMLILI